MKRLSLVFLITIPLLIACSSQDDGDAIIQEAKLTEYERSLTEILGSQSFAYDLELNNDEVQEVIMTVDHYENGERMENFGDFSFNVFETEDDDSVRVVFLRKELEESKEEWIYAQMTKNGHGGSTHFKDITERKGLSSSAWGGITLPTPLHIGDKQPIASIVFSNKDSIAILNDLTTENALKQQTDYEQVYILSVELK